MKFNIFLVFVFIVLTSIVNISCSKEFYQVYTLESKDLTIQDNSLMFENSDCKVSYNFWSEGGVVSFAFMNKTDKDIFINMKESFLIINGNAHDYFEGKTYSIGSTLTTTTGYGEKLSVSLSGNAGIWANKAYTTVEESKTVSLKSVLMNTISKQEQEIVCIPAKSYKVFSKFCISPDIYQKCEKKIDYPSIRSLLSRFDSTNSPLKMNNRLTYGFKNDNMDKHIDNVIWIGEIENFSKKGAIEKKNEKGCYAEYPITVKLFKIGSPTQFYRCFSK